MGGSSRAGAPQQHFAVVFAGGQLVEVELGGCYRVLRTDYSVGTADPAVINNLLRQP